MTKQPNAKTKGRRVPADPTPAQHLAQLEALHTKIGGMLHLSDQQADQIRLAAIAHHDQITKRIQSLQPLLESKKLTPELAREYGALLQQRKALQESILAPHARQWDEGHTSPI